jgi:hypothetical protein
MLQWKAIDTASLQALQAVPAVPDATLQDILMLVMPIHLYM